MNFRFDISFGFGGKDKRATKQTLTHPRDPVLAAWFGGGENTVSSMEINQRTALTISSVYAAIRAISEDISKLPLILYQRLDPVGKERATENPLFSILRDAPNDEMGSFDFREAMTGWALSWGNGYAQIERVAGGRVGALNLLPSDRVIVDRTRDGRLFYDVQTDEIQRAFPAQDIFHLHGPSRNGIVGMSVISLARESLGLTMALERFGSAFFGNNAMPGGVLEHPLSLKGEAANNLRKSWEDIHKGVDNSHKVAVLEEGMKWKSIGIPAEDAQFIESRQFQVEDVARWFRIPPHKIQHLLRATFDNIEHQSLEYVQDTLQPWAVRWEQEIQRKLITSGEQSTLFAEHLFDALLRGDTKTRAEALQIQRRNGVINADEWRGIENKNPLDNEQGKLYIVEKNMATLEQIENPPVAVAPVLRDNSGDDERSLVDRVEGMHVVWLTDAFARMLRVEQDKVTRAAKKDGFGEWREKFYKEHALYVRAGIATPIDSTAQAIWSLRGVGEMPDTVERKVADYTSKIAADHVTYSRELIDDEIDIACRNRDTYAAQFAIGGLMKLIEGLNNDGT